VKLPFLVLFEDLTEVYDVEGLIVVVLLEVEVDDVLLAIVVGREELDVVLTEELGELLKGLEVLGDLSGVGIFGWVAVHGEMGGEGGGVDLWVIKQYVEILFKDYRKF